MAPRRRTSSPVAPNGTGVTIYSVAYTTAGRERGRLTISRRMSCAIAGLDDNRTEFQRPSRAWASKTPLSRHSWGAGPLGPGLVGVTLPRDDQCLVVLRISAYQRNHGWCQERHPMRRPPNGCRRVTAVSDASKWLQGGSLRAELWRQGTRRLDMDEPLMVCLTTERYAGRSLEPPVGGIRGGSKLS